MKSPIIFTSDSSCTRFPREPVSRSVIERYSILGFIGNKTYSHVLVADKDGNELVLDARTAKFLESEQEMRDFLRGTQMHDEEPLGLEIGREIYMY